MRTFQTRSQVADIPVDHPSTSKQHAVLQFRQVVERNEFGDTKSRTKCVCAVSQGSPLHPHGCAERELLVLTLDSCTGRSSSTSTLRTAPWSTTRRSLPRGTTSCEVATVRPSLSPLSLASLPPVDQS